MAARTVVVGYDGSDAAKAAVAYAAERLADPDGRLIAVTVVGPSSSWATGSTAMAGPSAGVAGRNKERADAVLATLDELDLGGLTVQRVPGEGSPADVLLRVAQEEDATEIVVGGARGRGLSRRRLVQALLAGSACPVVVV